MRNFLKFFFEVPWDLFGVGRGSNSALFHGRISPTLVILVTYGMRYFTMEAVSLAYTFARDGSSSTMWNT